MDSPEKHCGSCGASRDHMKRCKKCKSVFYCDEKCQRENWPKHKITCIKSATETSPIKESNKSLSSPAMSETTNGHSTVTPIAKRENTEKTDEESPKTTTDLKTENETNSTPEIIQEAVIPENVKILNEGKELYAKGLYEDSYQKLTEGIQKYPSDAKLYESRSSSSMLTGRLVIAQNDAEKAISLDPSRCLISKIRLLKILVRRGSLERAIILGDTILKDEPTNSSVLTDLNIAKLNLRRIESARQALAEKKYQYAIDLTQTITKESPGSKDALLIRATCFVELGDLDEAFILTTRILRDEEEAGGSRDHNLLTLRAKILFEQERFDQSLKHLQEVLRENPDDSKAAKLLKRIKKIQRLKTEGDDAFKAGRFDDAINAYSNCLTETEETKLTSLQSKLYCNRAAALSSQNKYEEAIKDCDIAIELDPSYVKAYTRRALCLRTLGGKERLERAVFDYEKAEELQGGPTSETRESIRRTKQELKQAKRKNYYAILGITNNEAAHTPEDFKKAYKRAALKYHPDRHTNSTEEERKEAEAKFKECSEALMVLSDPQKRNLYDNGLDLEEIEQRTAHGGGGHHHHQQQGYPGGFPFDPSMFGGRGGGFGGFHNQHEGYPF